MPDLAMHYYFGQDVSESLPSDIRIDPDVFQFALSGPDDWFYCFTDRGKCPRGAYMHRNQTGAFLRALAEKPTLFSYFAGFFCHHILDATCHPYIIACTGFYEHTIETRPYRGLHTALERAIDRWILQARKNQGAHPLTDVMFGQPLPGDLEEAINQCYREVFAWEGAFTDLLKAKQKTYKYLRILENPHGMAKIVTDIVPHPRLKPLAYAQHYYEDADFLNLSHRPWHHPKDPSLTSTSSFPELVEKARQEAVKVITEVYHKKTDAIGNRSYLTGFDLDDPRNQRKDSIRDLLQPT
ncbi:MAG: hypothetical protein E7236_09680 [Lachnospiraceae bacterium]|nr:hypothetical protein [Lachnospiraceae bacterium]